MKKSPIIITIWLALITLSTLSFAQEVITIPTAIQENCILTESGTIDFCPEYRSQVRDLNLKLASQRERAEWSGVVSLLEKTNKSLEKFRINQLLLIKDTLKGYPLFIHEYELYLTTLFTQYIKLHSDENKKIVSSFFKTSYFDEDQSWLGISTVKLYKSLPGRYDDELILQIGIRNYTNNPISNIEDLYCFTTINNQDYIYPLSVSTSFKENTITNLIVGLKPTTSPLLENIGEKRIFCMLVYSQYWRTRYTGRGNLSFTLK